MKATTTVTTSAYYGNSSSTKNNSQSLVSSFISPQQMIKRLIPYAKNQKDKQNLKPSLQAESSLLQFTSKNNLVIDIQNLQSQLNNIHAEVIQSQNLLNVRDSLYRQLDILKDERQHIEGDISYYQNQRSSSKEIKVNVRGNHGYKQMNDRLRRRIAQIRQYIHKMELENRKIQQNINYTTALTIQKNYRTQVNSTAWVDNAYFNQRQRNMGRVDDLINRLHTKQQQALQKVRRQEEEIDRRNQINRASFTNTGMNVMGSRSYYGPNSASSYGGRRFYSPQYRL